MRKLLNLILVLMLLLFGCVENSDEILTENQNNLINERRLCPPGEELVVTVTWHWDIFEKFDYLTCKNGWGLCFQVGPKLTFDCKKVNNLVPANVTFDPQTNIGTSIGIMNYENKTCTFYFHKNIMNSSTYSNKNFSFLSIGPNLYIDEEKSKKLIVGDYPIIYEGDYFKYIIKYVEE